MCGSLFDIRHHIINIALLVCFSPLDNAHERRGWVEMGCCLRAFFPCGNIPSPAQGVTCTGNLCEIRGAGLAQSAVGSCAVPSCSFSW